MSSERRPNELRDRNSEILTSRLAGDSFDAIAARHQISRERARLIFAREARRAGFEDILSRSPPRRT